jgi:hypothetical protein
VKSAIENLGMSLLTVYLSGLSQEKTRMHWCWYKKQLKSY